MDSDRRSPYIYYFIRPISFIFTPIFTLFGVSANSITYFRFVIGFILCYFIYSDNPQDHNLIIYALIYNFIIILDHVDGNLARYYNRKTIIGVMFDGWADGLLEIFLFVSIGFYLGNENIIWGLFVSLLRVIAYWTDVRYLYIHSVKLNTLEKINIAQLDKKGSIVDIIRSAYNHIDNSKFIYFSFIFLICAFYDFMSQWYYYGGIFLIFLSLSKIVITILKTIRYFNVKYE